MNISQQCNNQQSFGMKFYDNKAFNDVVKYAKQTGKLQELDGALNKLISANEGDALIIHGKGSDGRIFSSINLNRRSILNSTLGAKSPEEASFNGIINLSEFGKSFKSLFGVKEPTVRLNEDYLIDRYSTKMSK